MTLIKETAKNHIKSQGESEKESNDFIPFLLDTYEIYKLSTKHYDLLNARVEFLLTDLYLRLTNTSYERVRNNFSK